MNVLVCGVGGQGVLLFSNLLSHVALAAGLDVKKSEVHGMAQRGGSVTSHIRFAPRVFSPLIDPGTADIVVAFEQLEALRYVHFLRAGGRLFYDPHRIDPLPVQIGLVERPADEELRRRIAARAPESAAVAAFAAAQALGNARVQNVVMLGAVAQSLEFPAESYHRGIQALVRPQLVDLNRRAFAAGAGLVVRS